MIRHPHRRERSPLGMNSEPITHLIVASSLVVGVSPSDVTDRTNSNRWTFQPAGRFRLDSANGSYRQIDCSRSVVVTSALWSSLMNDKPPPADHDEDAHDHAWTDIRAQDDRCYTICGTAYFRIPFGEDLFGSETDRRHCRNCGAQRGEIHVPTCCWEQCPRCGDQSISCDCQNTT